MGLPLGRTVGANLFREQESEDEEQGHCQEGAGTQTAQVSADRFFELFCPSCHRGLELKVSRVIKCVRLKTETRMEMIELGAEMEAEKRWRWMEVKVEMKMETEMEVDGGGEWK